jgi:hypothetical protein
MILSILYTSRKFDNMIENNTCGAHVKDTPHNHTAGPLNNRVQHTQYRQTTPRTHTSAAVLGVAGQHLEDAHLSGHAVHLLAGAAVLLIPVDRARICHTGCSVKSRLCNVSARMFTNTAHTSGPRSVNTKTSPRTAKSDLFTPPVCLVRQNTRPQSEHGCTHTIASGTQRLIMCAGSTVELVSCAHCITSHGYCPQVPHMHKVTLQHDRYDTPSTQHS